MNSSPDRNRLAVVTGPAPASGSTPIDWQALAGLLLEQCAKPALLMTLDGAVASCNQAAESLLGWTREELRGQPWATIGCSDRVELPIRQLVSGEIRNLDVVCKTSDERRLVLALELSVVGDGGAGGILVVILQSTVFRDGAAPPSGGLYYEVSAEPDSLGALKRVWGADRAARGKGTIGERCHRALYGRDVPCPGCPVFDSASDDNLAVLKGSAENASLRILAVSKRGTNTYAVSSQSVTDPLLGELIRARIDTLAEDSSLSERERAVLRYLLLGRNAAEIGTVLGISARTVRFHQSNLLEKIGADSRLDLLRLVL